MKGLILAAGKGTRLRPLTNTIAKHLLPVANKPILYYVLEQIRDAGIHEVGLVVSPETGPELKQAVNDGTPWGLKVTYILQTPALGLAHAVKSAREFLADSPFLLFLGDNLIQDGVKALVSEFEKYSPEAVITLKEVPDPRAFGVAEIDSSGKILKVVEKPKEPQSNLALVGAYIFNPGIFAIIDQLKPSWRGEYEITDAIQKLLETGSDVRSHILHGWWLDTGKKEDLLEANQILLDDCLKRNVQGELDSSTHVLGRVEIQAGAKITNSFIRGPVSIDANCRIENSFIGPFTSIGSDTVIENSSVEYSVILSHVHIANIPHLTDSVIGHYSEIWRQKPEFTASRLFVGDYSKVEL